MGRRSRLSVVDRATPPPRVERGGPWGMLPEPVLPGETQIIQRAQSLLSGPLIGACPPLTLQQAQDVLRWYKGSPL